MVFPETHDQRGDRSGNEVPADGDEIIPATEGDDL